MTSGDELKERRRRRKKDRKDADQEVLSVTGIRQMRKVKMVGYSGGSVDIPMPPRIATREANEGFAEGDEERIGREGVLGIEGGAERGEAAEQGRGEERGGAARADFNNICDFCEASAVLRPAVTVDPGVGRRSQEWGSATPLPRTFWAAPTHFLGGADLNPPYPTPSHSPKIFAAT
ncbi:hypothetical protein BDK51DRAFT_29292 [Blyttiomyces helicus]|uniref:Uncharacterized protein n=1 Tax=Blyttiomyces helicus TaxID=388810 RepID=A0A4P9VU72_9FUNG|nr:hypothetical protein BDK51DRAFT_29292 [Blyttiomyces helicus]|eukprot:RKO83119.1 hypothetical protein BDK51DRAFT_29292 [Blyttiomyces helicus]